MRKICAKCGDTGGRWGKRLHEHHINTDFKDDRPDNKIILCASCHKREHLRHGPSLRIHYETLPADKLLKSINKFNIKYGKFGGYDKLLTLASDNTITLTAAGRYFGVIDTSVYCWVKKFGIKWVSVVEKRNIHAEPYLGKFYNESASA